MKELTTDNLSPYGEPVNATCPKCGGNDLTTRETDGTTLVESVLYCNDCGAITPHTCPPVNDCAACGCLHGDTLEGWENVVDNKEGS